MSAHIAICLCSVEGGGAPIPAPRLLEENTPIATIPSPEKTCQHCAGSMLNKRPQAKFCARTCKDAAHARAWRLANPEKSERASRRWRSANQARCNERSGRWAKEHPESRRAATARRRARKRGAPGSYTAAEWLDKLALFANLCAYCGMGGPLTVDHKIPLTRGGSNDITNIVPACKPCNSRKFTKTAAEFLAVA